MGASYLASILKRQQMSRVMTAARILLYGTALSGLGAAIYRWAEGLGAATNLSDDYPWGLWIGVDVLSGVALAAGGFTIAAAVYVFHLEKYRPVLRPAILTATLGYVLVAAALLVDIGRPYRIWHPIVMWNGNSVMLEVAWCVMLYLSVLALEFAPAVFERWKWRFPFKLYRERWEKPLKVLSAFTLPLVFVGIVLSTLHQSSLGSLFLISPHRLHQLWYSPGLPLFFFLSAVAVGLGMVIIEAVISARVYGRGIEMDVLGGLGKAVPWLLGLYLLIRLADVIWRGALESVFDGSLQGNMFLIEIVGGVIIPMIMFSMSRIRENAGLLFITATLTVAGVVINRINVSIIGMMSLGPGHYFPSWMEFAITFGSISAGVMSYGLAVRLFNVFEYKEDSA
jgi:Ni/Fe-hydrogenase subunit HybB-like protein